MEVQCFVFNPFVENTYIVYDNENKDCWIIDPGCSNTPENNTLRSFIGSNALNPKLLINTHAHIDHILGNAFVFDTYGLKPVMHEDELPVLVSGTHVSKMYGVPYIESPLPERFISENETLALNNKPWKILFTPGHSPASLCFYNAESKILIGGDVLFEGSIGRTDLPGGNYETLIHSIRSKLFTLPNETIVYPGHGGITTIGQEKLTNPFFS